MMILPFATNVIRRSPGCLGDYCRLQHSVEAIKQYDVFLMNARTHWLNGFCMGMLFVSVEMRSLFAFQKNRKRVSWNVASTLD